MQNQATLQVENNKKYNIMRNIAYAFLIVTTLVYVFMLCFGLPTPPAEGNSAGQAAGEVTAVFFGITFVGLYAAIYAGCNIVTIVLSIICLVHDVKLKNNKRYYLDLGLVVIPVIVVILGFALPLLFKYGAN